MVLPRVVPLDGLFGCALPVDPAGSPLRPGGIQLSGELLDGAGVRAGQLVVDIGCGEGASVALMQSRGLIAVGVEASAATLRQARARVPDAALVLARGDSLPFETASVDGVLSECCLSLMDDRAKALAEWYRVMRRGGRLMISDVYRRSDGAVQEAAGFDRSPFLSQAEIIAALAMAGFRVEAFTDCSSVLGPWVARFIFEYGSLEPLWGGACGLTSEAVRASVPGYYTLQAVKPLEWEGEVQ